MLFFVGILLSFNLSAQNLKFKNYFFNGEGQKSLKSSFLDKVEKGGVIIVGEKHGFNPHHVNQDFVLRELGKRGYEVALGLEQVNYTDQETLNKYIDGEITSSEFYELIRWPEGKYNSCQAYTQNKAYLDPFIAMPFDCYESQMSTTVDFSGEVLALNAPRSISNKIFKGGLKALSEQEQVLLPPDFKKGKSSYKKRFVEVVKEGGAHHGGKLSKKAIDNMFTAQSLWDDTMAWQTAEYLKANPNKVVVIAVGNFHAEFGDGLKSRLRARGIKKVIIISQMSTE